MVEVIWTKKAVSQLESHIKYIKENSGITYAEIVLNRILSLTKYLNEFPKFGQKESLLEFKKSEYRYLVVWSYKIIYKVTKTRITISRIFHTFQNPNKIFK